ncbi:bifunctional DNA primase/polymerase [Fructilactobacillus sp. Tb1]|uniref:bifunctional DNA primase/polymerase n=1 Tax=Fructilactobacillus sp. Tb1 TaxID=3422304 RepID=UPI003D287963
MINELVEHGFEVYPVNGKKPLTEHGYKSASSKPTQLWQWESTFPNCNWAIRLDSQRLIVIDVDNHGNNDGNQSIKDNLTTEQIEFLSSSIYEKTPNNGYHFFFRLPDDLYTRELKATYQPFTGVEIKTQCINLYDDIRNGSLLDVAIAPDWVTDLMKNEPKKQYENIKDSRPKMIKSYWVKSLSELMQGTTEGNRNNWLTSVCGTWLRSGLDANSVYKLLQFANMNMTKPLAEKEVRQIFNSIYKTEARNG